MNRKIIDAVKTILAGDDALAAGTPVTCGALGVCPLHRSPAGSLEYLTYEEALQRGAVEISEVGDAGTVPELLLENNGGEEQSRMCATRMTSYSERATRQRRGKRGPRAT